MAIELPANKAPWPADAVERRDIADLVPYARNARTHSDEQVAQIAASMREWGWTNPVLVDEAGGIIAGHGRIMAARKLGLDSVPVMVARGWSDAQKRAYVIADNQLALRADWNMETLAGELHGLNGQGFALELLGFELGELDEIMSPEAGEGEPAASNGEGGAGSLSAKFGVPPFSVLNAREGWWQERKRAWLALGIQSELGRGEQLIPNGGATPARPVTRGGAEPGGSARPAMNYSKRQRGDGRGRPMNG